MNLLSNLFGSNQNSRNKDGLKQAEREAILDLLLLCTYADNHLSLAEDKILKEQIDGFSWDSGTSPSIYVSMATEKARRASANDHLFAELLQSIADRLSSPESKSTALFLMEELFRSDGMATSEKSFSDVVKKYLE